MDQPNYVEGPFLRAEWLEKFKDGAADQFSSTARHALEGCISGLTPTAAQTHVTPGEAYVSGNRLRLRANEAIDLAGLTRPTGNRVAWVTVLASYTTDSDMTVTDEFGVQHILFQNDGIIISLSRGTDANQSAAVKPSIPDGSIALCDILLDRTTAVGSLDGDQSRRPKCPADELREEDDEQWAVIRAIQATLAATLQSPDKGPTPSATSTDALQVDATWAAGTIPTGAPAIDKAKFRQRQAGEKLGRQPNDHPGQCAGIQLRRAGRRQRHPNAGAVRQRQRFRSVVEHRHHRRGRHRGPARAGNADVQYGRIAFADLEHSSEHARTAHTGRRCRCRGRWRRRGRIRWRKRKRRRWRRRWR